MKINNQAALNDQFNQWLAVDETNGNIGAIYYDTVGDAGRKKTDVYYQILVRRRRHLERRRQGHHRA